MRTIKILTAGPIRTMGMIHGPILTPYTVDDAKLRSLVKEGLNVVEILPDGSEKKLTLTDLMSNNGDNKSKNNTKKEAPVNKKVAEVTETQSEPETVEAVYTAPADEVKATEEVVETSDEETVSEERRNNSKNRNHKNNHRR